METNEKKRAIINKLIHDEYAVEYYHYTSLEVLFNILEGDSFWVSNLRFSNDATEERLIKTQNTYDDYIICFCDDGDKLSQWRGYCHNGGAAIKFNIHEPLEYSILHKDYDKTHRYELYENLPLQVVYVESTPESLKLCQNEMEILLEGEKDISERELIPYIKNTAFYEESETRMVFMNEEGNLSNCIRFRTLENGVKIPYMVVKQGNIGRMKGSCTTKPEVYTEEKIKEISKKHGDIWIEEGARQEEVYYKIRNKVKAFGEKNPRMPKIHVYCKGHMPIEKIIVAPTDDRGRIAEQVKRFCESKYWLRDVEVCQSIIPFIHR